MSSRTPNHAALVRAGGHLPTRLLHTPTDGPRRCADRSRLSSRAAAALADQARFSCGVSARTSASRASGRNCRSIVCMAKSASRCHHWNQNHPELNQNARRKGWIGMCGMGCLLMGASVVSRAKNSRAVSTPIVVATAAGDKSAPSKHSVSPADRCHVPRTLESPRQSGRIALGPELVAMQQSGLADHFHDRIAIGNGDSADVVMHEQRCDLQHGSVRRSEDHVSGHDGSDLHLGAPLSASAEPADLSLPSSSTLLVL